jgi:rod shape-determining protein MreC
MDRNIRTLCALLALSLILSYSPEPTSRPKLMRRIIEPAVMGVGRPIQKLMWLAGSQTGAALSHLAGSRDRASNDLRAENARLKQELGRLRRVDAENKRLRRLLEFREQAPERWIGARVIGRSPNSWFWQMTIDQGGRAGVAEGAPVCAAEGLVGQVIRVGRSAADVQLITDWDSGVGAIDPSTGAVGIVKGRGEPELLLTYLTPGSEVHKGDTIETSGLGGVYPPRQRIGRVTSVSRDRYSVAISASIEPAADFRRLAEVLILVPGPRKPGG